MELCGLATSHHHDLMYGKISMSIGERLANLVMVPSWNPVTGYHSLLSH